MLDIYVFLLLGGIQIHVTLTCLISDYTLFRRNKETYIYNVHGK